MRYPKKPVVKVRPPPKSPQGQEFAPFNFAVQWFYSEGGRRDVDPNDHEGLFRAANEFTSALFLKMQGLEAYDEASDTTPLQSGFFKDIAWDFAWPREGEKRQPLLKGEDGRVLNLANVAPHVRDILEDEAKDDEAEVARRQAAADLRARQHSLQAIMGERGRVILSDPHDDRMVERGEVLHRGLRVRTAKLLAVMPAFVASRRKVGAEFAPDKALRVAEIKQLVEGGMSLADAIREVAPKAWKKHPRVKMDSVEQRLATDYRESAALQKMSQTGS